MEKKSSEALPGHSAFAGSPESSDHPSFPGPPLHPGHAGTVDRFDLIRCIGEGGMGLVYLARDTAGSALVAIKILKPELAHNSRALAYFAKEAQHMQGLAHPNILPVLEFKATADEAYMVMPFRARGSLSNLLTPRVALTESLTLAVAQQIAAALHFAHNCEIVHRDVKPSNILLDETGRACLADFGLSRSLLNDVLIDVHQSHWEGTASYLSPGAARGEQEDTRLDIYSLGALLYEMLTGYPPYQGATRQDVIAQIIAGPPKPILELNPHAAPALIRIAEGAMARDLRERYAHLSFVLEDLDRVQRGQSPLGPHGGIETAASLDSQAGSRIGPRAPSQIRAPWMRIAWRILNWLAVGSVGVLGYVISPWFLPMNDSALARPKKPGLNLTSKFELPGVFSWNNAFLGDFNGDGAHDLFLPHDNQLLVVDRQGGILRQWKVPDPFADGNQILLPTNFDAEGKLGTFVSWRSGSNVAVSVLNNGLFEIKRFNLAGAQWKTDTGLVADSSVVAATVTRGVADGPRQLLALVTTGYARKPRGVYAFDYDSQALLWQFDIGPSPNTWLQLLDIDGDGREDLIFGSYAVENGHRGEDGSDDSHSYVYALSHDGHPLWRRVMGGIYSGAMPMLADLDGQGTKNILVWTDCDYDNVAARGEPEPDLVVRLDDAGEVTARYNTGEASLLSCLTADLNGKGKADVFLTDRLGQLHHLNSMLTRENKIRIVPNNYGSVQLKLWWIGDINNDGRPEFVFTSSQREFVSGISTGQPKGPLAVRFFHDNDVILLDTHLRQLGRFRLTERQEADPNIQIALADMDGDLKPEIVVLTDKVRVLKWTGKSPKTPP